MRMIGKEIFINRRVEFELCRLDLKKKKRTSDAVHINLFTFGQLFVRNKY